MSEKKSTEFLRAVAEYSRLKSEYDECQAELDRRLLDIENALLRRRDISGLMAMFEEAKKTERELGTIHEVLRGSLNFMNFVFPELTDT